jgi:hypothetical protein
MAYKYVRVNNGKKEEWTGKFDTLEKAKQWADKHLKFHEEMGHKLVLEHNKKGSQAKKYRESI